jgi:hypothetical protein
MGGFGVEGGVLTSIAFGAVTSGTALLETLTVGGGLGTEGFGVEGGVLTSIAFGGWSATGATGKGGTFAGGTLAGGAFAWAFTTTAPTGALTVARAGPDDFSS